MKNLIITIMTLWLFAGCSSLRVSVDYDPTFDFVAHKSFAIIHQNKEGEDTLFNDRLIFALEAEISSKAYIKTTKETADLLFVFHVNVEDKTDIDTDYQMLGFARYAYGGGVVATTRTHHYTKGTLIIDALNPKDNKIVWRGIATDILSEKKTPKERSEYLQNVVKKTMENFPPKFSVND